MSWRLPTERTHRLAGCAGPLTFVGGAGDFDGAGSIRHPGDLNAQLGGALENVAQALAAESCSLEEIVRLKAFYREGDIDEWTLRAALNNAVDGAPSPVMTLNPVPFQPWQGQEIQLQAIAIRGWRSQDDVRAVTRPVPQAFAQKFNSPVITDGLRAGEFYAVGGQTAAGADGETIEASGGQAQTHAVMSRLEAIQAELGASFQDAVKKEGYYFGTTMDDWAAMARIRASYFREPAAVATVVPCHALRPEGALTKVELLGMRELWNGFDKYIRAFDATSSDLRMLVCYFASDGSAEQTHRLLEAIDDCVAGPLPPVTIVPQPHLHADDSNVEVWGVADATRR